MGCKRYDGCISCVLFQISWQLQTQIVKNRILSDSLLGNKLYNDIFLFKNDNLPLSVNKKIIDRLFNETLEHSQRKFLIAYPS